MALVRALLVEVFHLSVLEKENGEEAGGLWLDRVGLPPTFLEMPGTTRCSLLTCHRPEAGEAPGTI